jgi:MFS family permease
VADGAPPDEARRSPRPVRAVVLTAPGSGGGTFAAVRHRNFRLYFIGQSISNTGTWLTNVALTLLVLKITHSGLAVGVLAACSFGPFLVFGAWAGAIADRVDKRRALMITQTLEMVQSFGLGALAFMDHPPLAALDALALWGGILLSLDNPLRRSFVTEMVPLEDRANAVVLYSAIVNLARTIGPALAGLLVVTLGYGWAFTIDGVTYLAVLICLALMRAAELHRIPTPRRTKGQVRQGLRYVMSTPSLAISFAMLLAIGTLAYNFSVTLPLFVTDGLHSSDGVFTILYSVFSLGSLVSALIIANRSLVRLQHIVAGAAATGVSMVLLAAMPTVGAAIPAAFLVGMASILYMTASTAIVQMEGRQDMHGRVLALQMVVIAGTAPIGGPLLGWMSDVLGGRAPVYFGGGVCLAAAAFGHVAVQRVGQVSATQSA